MHRSRVATVIIDFDEETFEKGAEFWSAALGRERLARNERLESLRGRIGGEGGLYVGLQRGMDDPQKFHLDIETDNVADEVSRLEGLGGPEERLARRVIQLRQPLVGQPDPDLVLTPA